MMKSSEENGTETSPISGSSWAGSGGNSTTRTQRRRKLSSDDEKEVLEQNDGGTASHRKDRSSRRNRKNNSKSKSFSESAGGGGGGGGGGSVLWTVLVIGLVFCIFDVFYIMGFVDRQHELFHLSGKIMHPELRWKQPKGDGIGDGANGIGGGQHKRPISIANEDGTGATSDKLAAGAAAALDNRERPSSLQELIHDKQHLIDLLTHAKVDGFSPDTMITSLSSLTESQISLIQDLPTWSEVVDLYYSNGSGGSSGNVGNTSAEAKPIIYGLELCEPFQTHSPKWDHFVSTAGTFNTGTNFMAELLIANCHMQDRMDHYGAKNRGVRWQVPW